MPISLGPNQLGECMRCGGKYLASQLQFDGRNPRLLVCATCWDPAHPQERPFVVNDVEGVPRHPVAPEILTDTAPVLSGAAENVTVELDWTRARTLKYIVTEYRIYRAPGSAGAFALVDTLEVERDGATEYTVTHPSSYTDEGLTAETLYRYRVDAITDHGRVIDSNEIEITTGEEPPPPAPLVVEDSTPGINLPSSDVYSFTYAPPATFAPEDNVVVLIYLTARRASGLSTPPTSISYGNVDSGPIQYVQGPVGSSTGTVHSAVAMIDLRGVTPDDDVVRVDWSGIGAEQRIGRMCVTVSGCGPDMIDFGLGVIDVSDAPSLAGLTVQNDDLLMAFGSHYTNNLVSIAYFGADDLVSDPYTMDESSGAAQSFFTNQGHHLAVGYRTMTASTPETFASPDFLTGFATVLRGE